MEGLKLLFWSFFYSFYNAIRYPGRRWIMECRATDCEYEVRGRSYNEVIARESLHIHFSDDHERPLEYESERYNDSDTDLVNRGGWIGQGPSADWIEDHYE